MAIIKQDDLFTGTQINPDESPDLSTSTLIPVSADEKTGERLYKWAPAGGDQKLAPVVQAFPNIGWQFVGFETTKEPKGGSKTTTWSNEILTKKLDSDKTALFKADSFTDWKWSNGIIHYKAIFNKNIYRVIVKPVFYNNSTKLDGVASINGITATFKHTPTFTKFNKIVGGELKTYDDLDAYSKADPDLLPSIEFDGISRPPLPGGFTPAPIGSLSKDNKMVTGDSLQLTISVDPEITAYSFSGWYVGDEQGNLKSTQFSDKETTTFTLNSDFIVKNGLEKHKNAPLFIYAKFLETDGNIGASVNNPEGGSAEISIPKKDQDGIYDVNGEPSFGNGSMK